MKDYVDLPLEIHFKPTQRPSVAVTRSQTYSSVYKVGHFYAIQPGSRSQEVRIAKCLRAFCDNFEGLILEKCAGTVSDKVFFQEKNIEMINSEIVYTLVISTDKYSVDIDEYEQLLMLVE